MPCNKWVFWVDEQTGEVSEPRKSPRHYTVYDAFTELYKIKQYLHHPQLTVKLVLMDMQEYKTLQQRIRTKKGIRRHGEKKDRIPIGIREIVTIEQLEDYMKQGFAVEQDGKVKINLTSMGVDKLLGFGNVSKSYDVTVAETSALAREKIEAAGGSIVEEL